MPTADNKMKPYKDNMLKPYYNDTYHIWYSVHKVRWPQLDYHLHVYMSGVKATSHHVYFPPEICGVHVRRWTKVGRRPQHHDTSLG